MCILDRRACFREVWFGILDGTNGPWPWAISKDAIFAGGTIMSCDGM